LFEDVRNYSSHSNVVSILELHQLVLGFGLFVMAQVAMAKWIMEALKYYDLFDLLSASLLSGF
jgi:hypothetical protein